jgi:hypothetical protein
VNSGVKVLARRLWPAVSAVLLATAVGLALWLRTGRWETVPQAGPGTKWTRGNVTHFDRTGDGTADEEETRLPGKRNAIIRRDTDLDGWFDVRYELRDGVVVRIDSIRERAPRH